MKATGIGLAELARDGRAEVRFIEMMPVGLGKQFRGRSSDEVLGVLERAFGRAEDYSGQLGNAWHRMCSFPDSRDGSASSVRCPTSSVIPATGSD